MDRFSQLVEHVAQQFYEAREAVQPWSRAPETLKEELRALALKAIELVADKEPERVSDLIDQVAAVISFLN